LIVLKTIKRIFTMKLTKNTLKQLIKEELRNMVEAQGLGHLAGKVTGSAKNIFNQPMVQANVQKLRAELDKFQDVMGRRAFVALMLGEEGLGVGEEELANLSMAVGRKTMSGEGAEEVPEEEGGLGHRLTPATEDSTNRMRQIARED
jgi:hypothetical protein